MSDEPPENINPEDDGKKNLVTIDFQKISEINSAALASLKMVQDNLPEMLKPLSAISFSFSPKLKEIMEATKSIQIPPPIDPIILKPLLEPAPVINSLKSDTKIIQQQQETIDLLKELLTEVRKNNQEQKVTLDTIFKMIRELKEEQRLEHPYVDKLYQMALEWGVDPVEDK